MIPPPGPGRFPDPVGWAVDHAQGALAGAAGSGVTGVVTGLTAWMLDAVVWVVGAVFDFFLTAADPDVRADWFAGGDGPYASTARIAAVLLVGFVLVGIAQGVLAGDVAGMLRRVGFELPMAVVAMVGLVTLTQLLIALTDALSRGLLARFAPDVERFNDTVALVSVATGGTASAFVVFLLALVAALAGIESAWV